ncbi:23662_t:CDS:1, partial [Gigaspora rosea]
ENNKEIWQTIPTVKQRLIEKKNLDKTLLDKKSHSNEIHKKLARGILDITIQDYLGQKGFKERQ